MNKNNWKTKWFSLIAMFVVSVFVLSACSLDGFFQGLLDSLSNIPGIEDNVDDDGDEENPGETPGTGENPNEPTELNSVGVTYSSNVLSGITITGTTLSWSEHTDVTQGNASYVVAYYSNSNEPTLLETETTSYSFAPLLSENNEIYAFRVGIQKDDGILLSNVHYYNPESYAPYTNSIYYFNGTLADYYIASQSELNHLAHYTFIYRLTDFNVKLANSYYDSITISNALYQAYNNSFMETISLSYQYTIVNGSNRVINIDLNFNGGAEPTLTLQKTMEQDTVSKPYYETVNYTLREETYNSFESDNNIMLAPVESSEELFWAVESGATPMFQSTSSEAYRIYQKAKTVLREIISNDMTDYEKLLSIFDYITVNTVYDYQIVSTNPSYTGNNVVTAYTSFYLEGVFDDGLAVCDGFSKAFSLLANMEGIPTVRIVGTVSGGGHAWNKTFLNGKWYVVDITWTELEMMPHVITNKNTEFLSHKYFLVSDAEITTHQADSSQNYKNHSAPNNYYYFANSNFEFSGQTYDLVITTTQEAQAVINYLWQNYQAQEGVTSLEFLVSNTSILTNWATIVRSTKDAYNAANDDRFDNDVLMVADSEYTKYATGATGVVMIVQIHNTFLNLQNK